MGSGRGNGSTIPLVPIGTAILMGVSQMTIDRRALATALAALLLVAACGGSASTAPSGAPEATATTPAASQEPGQTTEPTETAEPTEVVAPSLDPGAAGSLEAMLPSEANGVSFEKASFDGSTVPGGIPLGDDEDDFSKFLADNGKSVSDVKGAVASPTDASAGSTLVMAIQVKGVSSDALLDFVATDSSDLDKTTVGGKQVYGSGAAGFGAYFYVKDDTVFYVISMGGDAATTEDILRQLP